MDNARIRVLLIEDDEDDYILIKSVLSKVPSTKYDLEWASSYDAALEAMGKGRHDVYLLDYYLGEQNGLEFLREIGLRGMMVPVILLTGQGDYEIDVEAMRLGASDYLVKGQLNSSLLERSIRYAITQKITDNKLARSQKLEALGTLASGIAHDFNNILAGIIGFTEMVLEDMNPDSFEYKRLGLVLRSANRGRDLVKQILAFSRQTVRDRKPLALGQIVEEGLKLIRPMLPSTIEIISKSVTTDDIVLADPVQMHQILMNLCTNAAHAMREKGGRLDISISKVGFSQGNPTLFPEMTPGEYVMLKVGDTGCGMQPETIERIFDPFFTTKQQGEGTGLGLSVAHGIIKSHGGYVTVESKPGKGTTFQIYLPIAKEQMLSKDGEVSATTGGNECILIVDDEDILVELNKQRLSKLGYDVVATTNSTDALDIFRKEPDRFDLVITDYTMPNLTGMDLAAELLKIRATIPVILCTGHSETVSPEQVKESGIKAFLIKPLAMQELATAIRRVLDKKT